MAVMSDKEKKAMIQEIYGIIIKGNTDHLDSFFSDDVVLTWGPFMFEGIKKIQQWAKEFGEIFKNSAFSERHLETQGDKGINIFVLRTPFSDGRVGELYCTGKYEFHNGKIKDFKISINRGYVLVTMEVAKRLGIRKP